MRRSSRRSIANSLHIAVHGRVRLWLTLTLDPPPRISYSPRGSYRTITALVVATPFNLVNSRAK
jgi:hypothetical protein